MAKIQVVDYLAMPKKAEEMENCGVQLNNELKEAYESVKNMHKDWYGVRYNHLLKIFNLMIPDLNEMLKLVVSDIPETLKTVANNYSRVDRGENATDASTQKPRLLVDLAINVDVGMKFMAAEVQATQENVSKNFQNAVTQMNQIESIYKTVTWESEASEAFKSKFTTLKTAIVEAFEQTNTQFKTLMAQAQQDIDSAENANTVK